MVTSCANRTKGEKLFTFLTWRNTKLQIRLLAIKYKLTSTNIVTFIVFLLMLELSWWLPMVNILILHVLLLGSITVLHRCGLLLQMQQHGLFVGLSVCLDRETGKMAELIKMPFGLWTWVGPRNHVLDQVLYGIQIPHAKGQFWGEKGRPIVKYRDTLPRAVQKQLNRSRCHLGLELRWAQVSTH